MYLFYVIVISYCSIILLVTENYSIYGTSISRYSTGYSASGLHSTATGISGNLFKSIKIKIL